jgi:hypothetical protein
MALFKARRVASVAVLSTVVIAVFSFLPGSLGSQIAGAAPVLQPTTLTFSAAPNPAPFGTPVIFSATLSGGLASPDQPTGDISAGFYTSPTCSNSPSFTLDVSPGGVNGNGTYSAPFTPAAPGTYHGNAYFADTDGFNTSASSGSCNYVLVVDPPAVTTSLPPTPPVTTPPVTTPPVTTPPVTTPPVTTPPVTTPLPPTISPSGEVIPVGAPETGAGGAARSGDNVLLVALGGAALFGAIAATGLAIRRRRVLFTRDGRGDSGLGEDE